MLTVTATDVAPQPVLEVQIDVSSVVVRLALAYVSEERGWTVCTHQHDMCRCLRISDHPGSTATRRVDVLVTRDDPASCQAALEAVLSGVARSVVLWDEPDALGTTIEALRHGSVVVPERVIWLALDAPRLTERQHRTLGLVAVGRSNTEIARSLQQSTSTTKRDIAELLEVFDVCNRAALTAVANRLGFL